MTNAPLKPVLLAMALVSSPLSVGFSDEVAPVSAGEMQAPDAFIAAVIGDLKSLVIASGDDAEAREASLKAYLADHLSVRRMSRFVLSKTHREAANPAEIETYDNQFEAYITAVFGDQLDDLVTRRIEIGEVITRRPGDFIVRSALFDKSGDERAKIDWRVLEDDGALRLVDVIVEGISINVERRAQFSALVSNQGFQALLDHMAETIDGAASPA